MSNDGDSGKSASKVLEFAVAALKEQERELDRLTNNLANVKSDLLENVQKLDSLIGGIAFKLEVLEREILKLKPN